MPSPFRGMDPYLESPAQWPDGHHRLISQIGDVLTARLRPKYYGRVEERVFVDDDEDVTTRHFRFPDVRIKDRPRGGELSSQTSSTTALDESIATTPLLEDEIHEARVELIHREDRRVVTVLEVLSPTNKRRGSTGLASFRQKRREILSSDSHWVEIDLLRAGVRLALREPLPPCHYAVHVSRVQDRPQMSSWPIQLQRRLPAMLVPLKPEDGDTPLDLQEVLEVIYDRAGYDLDTDYRLDPVLPLAEADAAWADQLLKAKGLR